MLPETDYFLNPKAVLIQIQAKNSSVPAFLNKIILELQKGDFYLHDDTQMLVMLSISTNDMNRYESMYPEVWFIDCTSGETVFYKF
jgi:hypothetical protein